MLKRLFSGPPPSEEHLATVARQDAALKQLARKTGIPPEKLLDYRTLNGLLRR